MALFVSARSVAVSELMSKIAVMRRLPLLHDRVDRLQIGRAGQVLLDRLDDVVAHFRNRRAVVADRDRHGRLADVGVELLDDRGRRKNAREHHQRDDDENERRPLDEKPGKAELHGWKETFSPSPTLIWPLLTMRVPGGNAGDDRCRAVAADLGDLDRFHACRRAARS